MNEVVKITDTVAQHDDRWLFVFLLIFLLCSFGTFFRWLLKDRESITKRLTEITDRHIDQSAKLTEVVANNTNSFHEFSMNSKEQSESLRQLALIISRCNSK